MWFHSRHVNISSSKGKNSRCSCRTVASPVGTRLFSTTLKSISHQWKHVPRCSLLNRPPVLFEIPCSHIKHLLYVRLRCLWCETAPQLVMQHICNRSRPHAMKRLFSAQRKKKCNVKNTKGPNTVRKYRQTCKESRVSPQNLEMGLYFVSIVKRYRSVCILLSTSEFCALNLSIYPWVTPSLVSFIGLQCKLARLLLVRGRLVFMLWKETERKASFSYEDVIPD